MNANPRDSIAIQSYQNRPPRTIRSKVLNILHADGHVVTFGEKNLDVLTFNAPNAPTATALIEEYILQNLPRRFHEVYCPGLVRARGNIRDCLQPTELQWIEAETAIIRILDALQCDFESEVVIC